MKNLLTIIFSSLTITALAYAPIECRPTRAECTDIQEKGGKADRDCFVEPQEFCDALLAPYKQKEKQKYQDKMGLEAPTSFTDYSTNTPKEAELGSQAGTIQVLPVVGGFSIMAALVVGLFIFFRK